MKDIKPGDILITAVVTTAEFDKLNSRTQPPITADMNITRSAKSKIFEAGVVYPLFLIRRVWANRSFKRSNKEE